SCQTARCFNKSKGVLITGSKLKAFRNPQPSWGFSVHNQCRMAMLSGLLIKIIHFLFFHFTSPSRWFI
ncbi:hypothetical protein, partial [Escherichia coli]